MLIALKSFDAPIPSGLLVPSHCSMANLETLALAMLVGHLEFQQTLGPQSGPLAV